VTVLALDLSLTATGWATPSGYGVLTPPAGRERGLPRVSWIRDAVLSLAAGVDVVVIEGLAFGARGQAMLDLAGLGWVVRLGLAEAGVRYVDVPPAVLKKFATGKGNAPKPAMLAAAIRRLGYAGYQADEVDALWLLHAALTHYDLPGAVALPQDQREALAVVSWPPIGLRVAPSP
jgi:Holliday junction resolvasome RuvABC endonuclease subunit